jgi:hypothetical protein
MRFMQLRDYVKGLHQGWYKEKSGYVKALLMATATKRESLSLDEILNRFLERSKGTL